ncbi:MAG: sulfatase-like hydrolase/transferase [Rikenellaceae bacterium]
MKIKKFYFNSVVALTLRIIILFLIFGLIRVVFYLYNIKDIGAIGFGDIGEILYGSYIFDAASIFYANALFIFLSLLPFRKRVNHGYQKLLAVVYMVMNAAALMINIMDIFYFEFKQGRITGGDLHYTGEGNFASLFGSFIVQYWWGVLLFIILCYVLYIVSFRMIRVETRYRLTQNRTAYYTSQSLILILAVAFTIFAIRGQSISPARFPLSMSDAGEYVQPKFTPLIQSNPFCLIRTIKTKLPLLHYMPDQQAATLIPTKKQWVRSETDSIAASKPNIVFIILESFGSAHIKSLSDAFPKERESYTPFLDELIDSSLVFTNAYKSGLRSIDALPSILASIPSFKSDLLSFGESTARYKALPSILKEMGYSTMFLHGGTRSAMGYMAFGKMAGIDQFIAKEDYEAKYGTNDYDGKWGIFDHKFMPYALQEMNSLQEPFMAAIFTLSSHQPFTIPNDLKGRFSEGTLQIHRTIKYADWALRNFFVAAEKEKWFKNTIFVITGDHGSGADNDKYREMPYCNMVPIIFYSPNGSMRGKNDSPVQHIDIMPTVLSLLKYEKPFFSFGNDMLDSTQVRTPIVHYNNNEYYIITDSLLYLFNEKKITKVYDYKKDYLHKKDIQGDRNNEEQRIKAYLQQYFKALKNRNFTIENNNR